jgi:hypothetical protein
MELKGVGRVHFVCPEDRIWSELRGSETAEMPQDVLQAKCLDGLDCWILRTCYELRRAGYDVTIGPDLKPEGVNVAGLRFFGRKQRDVSSYVVIPRLDGHHPMLANFVIQQNNLTDPAPNMGHVGHWIQPNIQPRQSERGQSLSRLVYKGAIVNLDPRFRSEEFRQALAKMDVALVLSEADAATGAPDWGDYREADAVLAVRNLTAYDAQFKPASKLINAWWADVPALLGPEPAFQELRQTALDYVEIKTVDDVLKGVAELKAEPKRYAAMVENGRDRRQAFSAERTVQSWVALFEGEIAASYSHWQKTPFLRKCARYGRGMLREPFSKRDHYRRAVSGSRILPE